MTAADHTSHLDIEATSQPSARDRGLVVAAQAGSSVAISDLHALYSRRLYKRILAITRNREDAEDALQDTFVRVYLAIGTFEGRSTIYSWLTRIAINQALLVLRKRRARAEILFDPQPDAHGESVMWEIRDTAPNPEQCVALQQRRTRLLQAVDRLDAHLRMPLQMQMKKGSTIKEIGQVLNCSEGTVKARIHRARRRLSAACRDS
jgi:RNA polymerase sigma-70 factor, ECF subfamily